MASPLTVTTTSLPAATIGTAYTTQLTASGGTPSGGTGGTPTYLWTLSSSSSPLPVGLQLSGSGVISGTPATTAVTANSLVFNVTDGTNNATSGALTLTVSTTSSSTWWIFLIVGLFIFLLLIGFLYWMFRSSPAPAAPAASVVVTPAIQ